MMKNRMMPVRMSDTLSFRRKAVAISPAPRPRKINRKEVSAITKGLNLASHDTMIAVNPCPPTVIGVGIGGSFDYAAFLAKKALSRPVGVIDDSRESRLERRILKALNKTGVGPQGLGGDTTSLWVNVETYPTHIASLPVAVNVSCHATRHDRTEL